jgi:hypothetical protein
MTRPRRPGPAPPRIWCVLTSSLGLSPAQSRAWWVALARTTAPAAVALRTQVLLYDVQPVLVSPITMAYETFAPRALIAAIEGCVQSRGLPRRDATAIEEMILRFTTKDGAWVALEA